MASRGRKRRNRDLLDAARLLLLRLMVDLDLHARDDEHLGRSLVERAPRCDRPLVGARPIHDRGGHRRPNRPAP